MLAWLVATALAANPSGTYTLAHSEAETQAIIDAALDRTAEGFGLLYRSVVRRELAKIPEACDKLSFRIDDDELAWRCDKKKELVVPAAQWGETFVLKHKGKKVNTTVTRADSGFTASFREEFGGQTVVFTFNTDAGTVKVDSTVDAVQLRIPLAWSVTYARASESK